jgi:DNA polymerase III subunit epsilon
MKRLWIDCETTGLDNKIHGIHQLSGFIEIDDNIVKTFDYKIKPWNGCQYDNIALNKSNITKEQIQNNQSELEVYLEFKTMLLLFINTFDKTKTDRYCFCGYNVNFDKDFVNEFFIRNDYKYFFNCIWPIPIDVMYLAFNKLCNNRDLMLDFKLSTVANFLKIETNSESLHNSLYDIEITRNIFYELKLDKDSEPKINSIKYPDNKYVETIPMPEVEPEYIINSEPDNDILNSFFTNQSEKIEDKINQTPTKTIKKIDNYNTLLWFGKHKGKSITNLVKYDPDYIIWLNDNMIQGIEFSKNIMSEAVSNSQKYKDNKPEAFKPRNINNTFRDNEFDDMLFNDDLPF